jgi:ankyrin repeat protein
MLELKEKQIRESSVFVDAVVSGNEELVNKYLSEEKYLAYINADTHNGPIIMTTVNFKYWNIFLKLFEEGADINVKNDSIDWYLIHQCIEDSPLKILKNVIKYADVNVVSHLVETPLMLAIKKNKQEAINFLFENPKTNYTMKNPKTGDTALHYAAASNNEFAFIELLKKGVNFFNKNKKDKIAIDLITNEELRLKIPLILEEFKNLQNETTTLNTIKEEKVSQKNVDVNVEQSNNEDKKEITSKTKMLGKIIKK